MDFPIPLPDFARDHLPVLVVILPLFGGLLSLFTGLIQRGGGVLAWLWSVLITGLTLLCAAAMLFTVQQSDAPLVYRLGSWPEQWGIGYSVDPLNGYVILVVALIGFLTTIYAKQSVAAEIPRDRHHLFYAVWLLALAGLVGITVTGDTFNIYVLLEISSLTVYTLIALGGERDRRALTASLKYLILGSIGATFILLGIGYLLMLTGTLNMADMHDQLMKMRAAGELADNKTVLVSFAFLMVGLSLKMALFPLHLWLPNAYTYAPSAVSALVAATATKVGVYMTFRFVFTIYGGGVFDSSADLYFLALCAGAGVIVSSLAAIRQMDVKKVLAYSSVGQIAYIVLGFSLANESGVTASVIHIFNHAVIKGGMFMACGAVALRVGGTRVEDFKGLGRRMPLTMAAFTVGGCGLIGVPMTAGFVSKWYLVVGAMNEGYWLLALVVLLGGVLALIYVWRLVEIIYFKQPDDPQKPIKEAPLTMLIPMWILIAASVFFGLNASWTANSAAAAANLLLGGGP
ncbi:monovalent cation/H+ antiporter subunit D family protein [Pseudenhygromyxa sp. WMMC2535]|uniref:monovalent cation/H+ antiporter subunit D family protein n=1 Tax=Pseudenhygromyxa sp. WMMC2535 TaxID=2712867 RepID=UPI001554A690|nr:monovalent cation/H+ antiporter subunit D family protein [Pseudenhygromyxa sp. WMMC2535]NVB42415.1 monovalent cation/H+ antiporter subunit D family protein [Pseudenhygromyxa sp. WMMC2535]